MQGSLNMEKLSAHQAEIIRQARVYGIHYVRTSVYQGPEVTRVRFGLATGPDLSVHVRDRTLECLIRKEYLRRIEGVSTREVVRGTARSVKLYEVCSPSSSRKPKRQFTPEQLESRRRDRAITKALGLCKESQ